MESHTGLNIFCDFDGTISNLDVTDELLETFALPEWQDVERAWKAGRIGSRECMRRQVELLRCSQDELDHSLARIGIDPGFIPFVSFCRSQDLELHILSDGIDYAIHSILDRHGVDRLPVYSNHLLARDGGWRLEFPYADTSCSKGSGVCKCSLMRALGNDGGFNILIGDGASDFCAAASADLVLAKDKLLGHCRATGLPHIGFTDFDQIIESLGDLIQTSFARSVLTTNSLMELTCNDR